MKRSHLLKQINVVVLLVALFAVLACDREDVPTITPVRVMELATVTDTLDGTRLEVWNRQNQSIPLSTTQILKGAQPGMRLQVYYEAEVADTVKRPIPIKILGAATVASSLLIAMPEDIIAAFPKLEYEILSQWQTGPWLNFQLKAKMGEKTLFFLMANEETLDADEVECYFMVLYPPEGNAYTNRRLYASYDVTGILTRPGQTIKIIPQK